MTVAQVKEAIRKRTPIRIRLIFGEEIEYKRAIVVLPPHGNAKEPVVTHMLKAVPITKVNGRMT